jgi:hypothetical protein
MLAGVNNRMSVPAALKFASYGGQFHELRPRPYYTEDMHHRSVSG